MSVSDVGSEHGYVVLTLVFRREGRQWLGECVELGTAAFGRSLEQARTALIELVELHLETLEKIGERERFFGEHGISLYTDAVPPPQVTRTLSVGDESYVHAHLFPVVMAA